MMILFPWPAVLALAGAALVMTYLAWSERRKTIALRAALEFERREHAGAYARGQADGLDLGYRRAQGEQATTARGVGFREGYAACERQLVGGVSAAA